MKSSVILTLFLLSISYIGFGQVAINTTGASPDASSVLDVSSNDKGILIPRLDTSAVTAPALGLLLFQPSDKQFYYFDGILWKSMSIDPDLVDNDGDTGIVLDATPDNDEIHIKLDGDTRLKIEENDFGVVLFNVDNVKQKSNVFLGVDVGLATGGDSLVYYDGTQNIGIGHSALKNNTRGNGNIALGNSTLDSNIDGVGNIGLGGFALYKNIDGDDNIAIGSFTYQHITKGLRNVALGAHAMRNTKTGNHNVSIGYAAGHHDTLSNHNVYVGQNAGSGGFGADLFHTKENSVMIGSHAGYDSKSNSSVFLGYYAGAYQSVDNRLYISNFVADSTEALIYGEFDNDLIRLNGRVAIRDGITDGDGDSKVVFDQTADDDVVRIFSDSIEVANFSLNPYGSPMISSEVGFPFSTFLGKDAGIVNRMGATITTQGARNTGVGYLAMSSNTTGYNNSALGFNALRNNTTGATNTAIGNSALESNTSAWSNVAVGHNALKDVTIGDRNTSIGYAALQTSKGSNSVAVGYGAGLFDTLSTHNVFIGSNAGRGGNTFSFLHDKKENVMIGHGAGFDNQGDGNVFLGNDSGYFNQGDGNIFIGNGAGSSITGSNQLIIDNQDASSTEALIFGNFSANILRFNAGLTISKNSNDGDPQLNIYEDNTGLARLQFSNTSGKQITVAAGPSATTDNSSLNFFIEDAGNVMTVRGNKRVGINDTSPSQTLEINATAGDEPFRIRTGATVHLRVNAAGETTIHDALYVDGVLGIKDVYSLPQDYENFKILKTSVAGSTYWEDEYWLRTSVGGDLYNLDENIGMGLNDPSYKLEVEDDALADFVMKITNDAVSSTTNDGLAIQLNSPSSSSGNQFISFKLGDGSTIAALRGNNAGGVALAQLSDRRHKQNIESYTGALALIDKIDAYTYEMKAVPGKQQIGFIAQELYKSFPQIVSGTPETTTLEDPMMVDYASMTPVLLAAIKELVEENKSLSKELETSNSLLSNLSNRITAIEASLSSED